MDNLDNSKLDFDASKVHIDKRFTNRVWITNEQESVESVLQIPRNKIDEIIEEWPWYKRLDYWFSKKWIYFKNKFYGKNRTL
jgi:hypothetical protein